MLTDWIWENRQCENWPTLTPRSSETGRRTKNWPDLGTCRPLEWTVSLCSMPLSCCRPVRLRCLFDHLYVDVLGENWPINERIEFYCAMLWPPNRKFSKIRFEHLRLHGFRCRGRIWWKSAVGKLTKCHLILLTKKPACPNPPFYPHPADRTHIFWTLSPLDLYMSAKLRPNRFTGVIERFLFLEPKAIGWKWPL